MGNSFTLLAMLALGAPQSAPSAAPTSGTAPLTVTFSPNDPNGTFYQWQFNYIAPNFVPDYSSEIGENVSYTYTAPGTYKARLRLYDLAGGSADTEFTITVYPPASPPTVSLTFAPYPTLPDQTVTLTAQATPSPGRSIVAYSWDFNNDGIEDVTSPGGPSATATCSFPLPLADHPVTVTAVDNGGLAGKATSVVMISSPPAVKITGTVSRLILPGTAETFAVTADPAAPSSPPRTLDRYDWNFGDGTTAVSPAGGSASVSHSYAAAGSYTVAVTATDSAGHSKTVTLPVQVSNPPAALLSRNELEWSETTYTVITVIPGGDSIVEYRWDYTGNAAIDRTTSTPTIIFTPGDSCKPIITVTVDFQFATDLTLTAPFEMKVSTGMVVTPIPIVLTATADGNSFASGGTIRVGHVVNFLVTSAGDTFPSAPILKEILWDFDGDGLRDQVDDLLPLNTQIVPPLVGPPPDISASYQFRTPGSYKAAAKVIGVNGNDGTTVITVNVSPGAAPLECFISQPRPGQRVWGNHVTIQAKTVPAVLTQQVEFRYSPSGAGTWTTIGIATPPPYTALSVSWDVTGLPPGDYDLLAVATNTSPPPNTALSSDLQPVTVTVDPLAPDEEENSGDILVRVHSIDPNVPTRSEIAGDTAIEFPPHAFGMEYTTIRLERPFSNPHLLEARLQGLQFVPGSFRRLALDGGAGLQKPSKIALYDLNPNGILDELNVDPSRLKIYQFDGGKRQWVPLFGQVVQPGEDLARATLMSMGDVGLVMEPPPRAPADSSSSGCGLLGPELLVLALLFARRRRVL